MGSDLQSSCEYSLAFPYHKNETASERLLALQKFVNKNNLDKEYLCSGVSVSAFEKKIAALFGKPAAMWCPTGTLAQGIAARLYTIRSGSNRILLHPTSHLLLHENDGYRYAYGLEVEKIGDWHAPLSAELLKKDAACAFVELPQRHNGGYLPAWEELNAIKQRAEEIHLPLHMDGARIWPCRAFYDDRSYAEIAEGFSSIYVSLYKDIGALGGALLIGDEDFIADARIWRTRLGGLIAAHWPMICDADRLLNARLSQMSGFVSRAQEIALILKPYERLRVAPEPPHVNMIHLHMLCSLEQAEKARDEAARQTGVWLGSRFWDYEGPDKCALEIIVGQTAFDIPDERLASAVSVFDALL